MEACLEQFIPSDKSKNTADLLKNIATALIVLGVLGLMAFFFLGLLLLIAALIITIIRYTSFIDYEYELYDGDIDVSKIYCGSRRKMVKSIKQDNVISVSYTAKSQIGNNGASVFFNSNTDKLNIYTFELQGSKKVQLALNEDLEKIVKIVYRQKLTL